MSASEPLPRVAAFDVDHTITSRDCVLPFCWRVSGPVAMANGILRHSRTVAKATARRDRDLMKRAVVAATFAGHRIEDVTSIADEFAADVHAQHLREDIVGELRARQGAGDVVVLVSASFEVYLRPLAALLGVDHVLATRLEVDDTGTLTGRLAGANCRGPEKVRRLHTWLDEYAGGRAAIHLSAYGDSTGDREMLLDGDEAHWVGRRAAPAWFPTT